MDFAEWLQSFSKEAQQKVAHFADQVKDKYEDYVEIEFPSVEEAEAFTDIPKWFGEEVTGQKEHNMASIFNMIQELK